MDKRTAILYGMFWLCLTMWIITIVIAVERHKTQMYKYAFENGYEQVERRGETGYRWVKEGVTR